MAIFFRRMLLSNVTVQVNVVQVADRVNHGLKVTNEYWIVGPNAQQQVVFAGGEWNGLTVQHYLAADRVDPQGADDAAFAYQLRRTVENGAPEDRFFRVEFDLTQPVEAPPAAWGWE